MKCLSSFRISKQLSEHKESDRKDVDDSLNNNDNNNNNNDNNNDNNIITNILKVMREKQQI